MPHRRRSRRARSLERLSHTLLASPPSTALSRGPPPPLRVGGKAAPSSPENRGRGTIRRMVEGASCSPTDSVIAAERRDRRRLLALPSSADPLRRSPARRRQRRRDRARLFKAAGGGNAPRGD